MKDSIEYKLEGAKNQLDQAKIRFQVYRDTNDQDKTRIEKENICFWEGYLTALEELKNEGV